MIAEFLVLLGSVFFLIAAVGIIRLPDLMARLHAGTKAASLGVILLLGAAAIRFHDLGSLVMIALTLALVFLTAPLGSHVIAKRVVKSDAPSIGPKE
ncbi:MAG: monovalent cation/H(+) antiporter subunit G [Akkermansiaceae bacterium]|jgi:multicomponent Na+:H+ antiporter subunit G|nr:monovalent cation/H(+) antiporter subunit G [Akkermansiaceae bacterium]